MHLKFQTHILSKRGGRELNEDHCGFISLEGGVCWVLADGLGGHGGGEIASHAAVASVLDSFAERQHCSPRALESYLESANQALKQRQSQDPRLAQMRTTTVILVSDFKSALWAHVGDSRLYCLQRGRIAFQTRDQSVPQALCEAGKISPDEIRFHPDRNRLLRALGNGAEVRPRIQKEPVPLSAGDAFILCSDGFWEYLTETEMESDFARSRAPKEWLTRMEDRLGRRAPEDHDNYSAMGIFVTG